MSGRHRTTPNPALRYLAPRLLFAALLIGALAISPLFSGWLA